MPLTAFQQRVLQLLAGNRSPESYLAGATVIHRPPDSPRFSEDLDFFHDVAESVAVCAEHDATVLRGEGYEIAWQLQTPAFYRAMVSRTGQTLKLEWAQDTAFRFFPVERDATCGYRLHVADAAVNKILAVAGRSEVRDFVDLLYLDRAFLPIGALCWAACGKDPGFTPEFLLQQINRHAVYTQHDLDRLMLSVKQELPALKRQWLAAMEKATTLVNALPGDDMGCLYLNARGEAVAPDPGSPDFFGWRRHFGSPCGAWPVVLP
ncbi:MAG: nucleotidyl transferase AbiEii/AbiGii toxin family protein [Lentisphaeria bacterium]